MPRLTSTFQSSSPLQREETSPGPVLRGATDNWLMYPQRLSSVTLTTVSSVSSIESSSIPALKFFMLHAMKPHDEPKDYVRLSFSPPGTVFPI